jgi:hypothetical protein
MAKMTDHEFNEIFHEVDYYDIESVVKFFWICSIEGKMEEFNFEDAFDLVRGEIAIKLNQHGLLGKEECVEYTKEFESETSGFDMDEFARNHSTDYLQFTGEELSEALFGYMCEKAKEEFEDYDSFVMLMKTYKKLNKSYELSERDKVLLFDECIHAAHETGQIFDIDMDDLHAEVDALYE